MDSFDVRLLKLKTARLPDGELHEGVAGYSVRGHRHALGAGLVPVVQAFLGNLLTDPGTDAINPQRGGGLLDMVRKHRVVDREIKGKIRRRVRETERFMKEEQRQMRLSEQERVEEVEILSIEAGESKDELKLNILLTAASGDAFLVSL